MIRYSQDSVLALVEALYTVAEGTENWLPVLERLRVLTRSAGAVVRRANFETGEGEVVFGQPFDERIRAAYGQAGHPAGRALFTPVRLRFITEGAVIRCSEVVPDAELEQTEFYRVFLEPHGFFYWMNLAFEVRGTWVLNLTLTRARAAGDYDEQDLALLERLAPHFKRAMDLYRMLAGAVGLKDALESSIDRLPIGVALVDADGRALAVNDRAQEILARHDGLRQEADGTLRAGREEQAADLGRLIEHASRCGQDADSSGGTLSLDASGGGRPLSVMVTPLRLERQALGDPRVLAAVFISDPDRRPAAAEESLQRLYGLTRAEARLASLLVSGHSLEEVARRLKVTTNTARTHLKRVFAKTKTSRQGDLVSLVLSGVEALRPSELPRSRPAGG